MRISFSFRNPYSIHTHEYAIRVSSYLHVDDIKVDRIALSSKPTGTKKEKVGAYSLVQLVASRGLHVSRKCGRGSPIMTFIASQRSVSVKIPAA